MTKKRSLALVAAQDLIEELEERGYIVKIAGHQNLTWSRTVDPGFSMEVFQWEAVHKIAGQLVPQHLRFTEVPASFDGGMAYVRAKLNIGI